MASGFVIRKNQYYDSVFLMGVSKKLSDVPGVRQNAVLMGSPANKGLLLNIGIRAAQIDASQPNDLIVAVIADTSQVVAGALGRLEEFLQGGIQAAVTSNPHTLEEGLARTPKANLAVISVPGEYAAREARKALESGLNVFLFSSNVSSQEELDLKQLAAQKNLLVMGPDCGSSLIGGVGLGFANAVRRGPIGAVCAAGTGLQEFTSQIHNAGSGISHAIGTGGHDISDQIGGLTTFAALEALEKDAGTEVIVVISKPPGSKTLARLSDRFEACSKPVIACLLGTRDEKQARKGSFRRACTIDEAAQMALEAASVPTDDMKPALGSDMQGRIAREKASWSPDQRYLRGVFAGGTLCYQSQQILRDAGIIVHSNAPLDAEHQLADSNISIEHTLVDLGAEEYTVGRPHPMIDGSLRRQRILVEARDRHTAVILLDFILGYNASMDPVGDLLDAILEARQIAAGNGRVLTVVASVCGTLDDPQDLEQQIRLLREAGVFVFQSSAAAALLCVDLVK